MQIRKMIPTDAEAVAKIHSESISSGFISSLPYPFVVKLYRQMAKSKNALGFVCVNETLILGFIFGSIDTKRFFKELLLSNGIVFFFSLFRSAFDFSVLKKIINNVLYASKFSSDLPKAEILSVAIKKDAQNMGVGKMLMDGITEQYLAVGIREIKALTDEKNADSNRYYVKRGFKLAGKIKHHDHYLNIYILSYPK